jgi:hypothetical protein
MMQTLRRQVVAIDQSLPYLLSRLRINAPGFVAMIAETMKAEIDEWNQWATWPSDRISVRTSMSKSCVKWR